MTVDISCVKCGARSVTPTALEAMRWSEAHEMFCTDWEGTTND